MAEKTDNPVHAKEARRRLADRRTGADRRTVGSDSLGLTKAASWKQQRTQCLTRYLFFILGLLYFNLINWPASPWVSLTTVNVVYVIYGLLITATLLHARYRLHFQWRWRTAMWVDLFLASFSVLTDPSTISPAYMAYVMIILGNGMRYGQRFFAETVGASLIVGALTSLMRFSNSYHILDISAVFYLLFGCIIVLYTYHLTAELDRARKRLEEVSTIDELTGLYNRRGLYRKAEKLFEELTQFNSPMAILFADLDKFKAVNDVMGHHTGDRVLSEIAELLNGQVRETDVVGRIGGDEFVLLLPETDMALAEKIAQRIQSKTASWVRSANLDISMSIGIGMAPLHGSDFKSVLTHVDQAMYKAKSHNAGGGIVCVDINYANTTNRNMNHTSHI